MKFLSSFGLLIATITNIVALRTIACAQESISQLRTTPSVSNEDLSAEKVFDEIKASKQSLGGVWLIDKMYKSDSSKSKNEIHRLVGLLLQSEDANLVCEGITALRKESDFWSDDPYVLADIDLMIIVLQKLLLSQEAEAHDYYNFSQANLDVSIGLLKGISDKHFLDLLRLALQVKDGYLRIDLIKGACSAIGERSYSLIQQESLTNQKLHSYMQRRPLEFLKETGNGKVLYDAIRIMAMNNSFEEPGSPMQNHEMVYYSKIIGTYSLLALKRNPILTTEETRTIAEAFSSIAQTSELSGLVSIDRRQLVEYCLGIATFRLEFADKAAALAVSASDNLEKIDQDALLKKVAMLRLKAEEAESSSNNKTPK